MPIDRNNFKKLSIFSPLNICHLFGYPYIIIIHDSVISITWKWRKASLHLKLLYRPLLTGLDHLNNRTMYTKHKRLIAELIASINLQPNYRTRFILYIFTIQYLNIELMYAHVCLRYVSCQIMVLSLFIINVYYQYLYFLSLLHYLLLVLWDDVVCLLLRPIYL